MKAPEKEIEFWEKIPTTFDDTRVLQGNPGEYIVTARRSGGDWFVGAMTNNPDFVNAPPKSRFAVR